MRLITNTGIQLRLRDTCFALKYRLCVLRLSQFRKGEYALVSLLDNISPKNRETVLKLDALLAMATSVW
jgi:hypothetical protein